MINQIVVRLPVDGFPCRGKGMGKRAAARPKRKRVAKLGSGFCPKGDSP